MQVNLFEVMIGAQFLLFVGYLLYGVLRKHATTEVRSSISFYVTVLIGFITFVFVLNSSLSLQRFSPNDIPIVFSLLILDIILLLIIVFDTFRLKRAQSTLTDINSS